MTDYFPWFRFRAADFIGGTAGMTMEERGAYITLLSHQWMHGPLPACPEDLARICGGVTVSKRVTDKFRNVEGTPHCINDKLEEDRAHALKSRDGSKKRQRKHKKSKGKSNALPERDETVTKQLPSISNTTVGSMDAHGKTKPLEVHCAEPEIPASAPEAFPVAVWFECTGVPNKWPLTEEQVRQWQELFPGFDVLAECKHANAWELANPAKRKTFKGKARFLLGWLKRHQDSGRGRRIAPEAKEDPNALF